MSASAWVPSVTQRDPSYRPRRALQRLRRVVRLSAARSGRVRDAYRQPGATCEARWRSLRPRRAGNVGGGRRLSPQSETEVQHDGDHHEHRRQPWSIAPALPVRRCSSCSPLPRWGGSGSGSPPMSSDLSAPVFNVIVQNPAMGAEGRTGSRSRWRSRSRALRRSPHRSAHSSASLRSRSSSRRTRTRRSRLVAEGSPKAPDAPGTGSLAVEPYRAAQRI
jgi:hypothetical protein